MSIKKLLLLTSMALALVAFAVPAVASASQWRDATIPITTPRNLSATGTAQFNTVLGGVHCKKAQADFTIENKSGVAHGTGTAFTAKHPAECHGFGALEGCTVADSEITNPVTIEVDPNDSESVTITDVELWAEYVDTVPNSKECGVEETELDFLTSHVNPETPHEPDPQDLTASFHRNGSGGITNLTITAPNKGVLTAFGLEVEGVEVETNLTVDAPNDGTYQLN